MGSKRPARTTLVLAAVMLAGVLLAPSSGRAAPLVTYKCHGMITYQGHAFEWFGGHLWSWDLISNGTCIGGFAQQLTYSVTGRSMPSCGGPTATASPKEPNFVYLTVTTITNTNAGWSKTFRQQWVGLTPLQINAYNPVPSRYIPIGGITGVGIGAITKRAGTWADPIVRAKVVFMFAGEEIPGTDQPDGQAC